MSEFLVHCVVFVDSYEDLTSSDSMASLSQLLVSQGSLLCQLPIAPLSAGRRRASHRKYIPLELPSFLKEERSTVWDPSKASPDRSSMALATSWHDAGSLSPQGKWLGDRGGLS